jgi:hypothetical protein
MTKAKSEKANPFEKLLRSTKYKALPPCEKLTAMLSHRTFKDLLEQKHVLDVQDLAARTGYTPQHVRVLCRQGKIDCIKRGYGASSAQADEEFQYFFLPEQAAGLFATQKGKA